MGRWVFLFGCGVDRQSSETERVVINGLDELKAAWPRRGYMPSN